MNSMNESSNYENEQEELILLMEQMQTTNERLQAELKGLQQKYFLLQQQNSQQETQIQTLLSDKQKLSEQVQKQMLQVAQQAELIEKLNESDKQLSEANKKLKDAEQKKKESDSQLKEAKNLYSVANQRESQLKKEKAQLLESIDKSAEERARQLVYPIRNEYENKQRRVNKFTVAAISILMIYSMCVTGAWISDHTGVFVGQTGVVNFFVSFGNGFVSVLGGIKYLIDNAVNALQGSTGDLIAGLIVYGLFAVLGLTGIFWGIRKGIPKLKKNFGKIMRTYEQNGVLGYKKAMTVSLCVIALCFAILLAEYSMVNVIGVWLLMSVGLNLTYHLFTYER